MKRTLLLLLAAFFLPAAHARVEFLPGSSPQTTKAYTSFPNLLFVRPLSSVGLPFPGGTFTYSYYSDQLEVTNAGRCQDSPFDFPITTCTATADMNGLYGIGVKARYVGEFAIDFGEGQKAIFTVTPAMSPPVLEVIEGANQRIVVGAPLAPIKLRATRDGVPLTFGRIDYGAAPGSPAVLFPPLPFSPSPRDVSVGQDGIATLSGVSSASGYGAGAIEFNWISDLSGVITKIRVPFTVTDAAGRTVPDLAELWWGGASQNGWGMHVPRRASGIFPVFFGYDPSGRPTWRTLEGAWDAEGKTFKGAFNLYHGAPFFAFDTALVRVADAGVGSLSFDSGEAGALSFRIGPTITPPTPTYASPITGFHFGSGGSPFTPSVDDLWWGGPGQSGWGITVAKDGDNLFLAWYTYDANGDATWFSMPEGAWSDRYTWTGPVYRNSGTLGIGAVYDASKYSATQVGTFTLRYSQYYGTATFEYTVDGRHGVLNLQRFYGY